MFGWFELKDNKQMVKTITHCSFIFGLLGELTIIELYDKEETPVKNNGKR